MTTASLPKEPEEVENEWRLRVRDPSEFIEDSFRTVPFNGDAGIFAVMARPLGAPVMRIQSLRFKKDSGWDADRIRLWLEDHSDLVEGVDFRTLFHGRGVEESGGRRIRGVLALPRISRNHTLYLPEELASAEGKRVPVFLEHGYDLNDGMVGSEPIGEALLSWNPVLMQLRYEGVLYQEPLRPLPDHVSLGARYQWMEHLNGYAVPRGLDFYEMSLVADPGIPETTVVLEGKDGLRVVEHVAAQAATIGSSSLGAKENTLRVKDPPESTFTPTGPKRMKGMTDKTSPELNLHHLHLKMPRNLDLVQPGHKSGRFDREDLPLDAKRETCTNHSNHSEESVAGRLAEGFAVTQTTSPDGVVGVAPQSPKSGGEAGEITPRGVEDSRRKEKENMSRESDKESTNIPYASGEGDTKHTDECWEKLLTEQRKWFEEFSSRQIEQIGRALASSKGDGRQAKVTVADSTIGQQQTPEDALLREIGEKVDAFFSKKTTNYASWSVPRLEVPDEASGKNMAEWYKSIRRRKKALAEAFRMHRVTEALATGTGEGQVWAPSTFVIPPGLPAALRNTCIVVDMPRGADRVNFSTVTTPAFASLTENTEPTEVTHTLTQKTATPSPYGWQQSASYEKEQKFGNKDIMVALTETARLGAVIQEDTLVLTTLDGVSTGYAGRLFGDESVSAETNITSTMTFKAARLRTAIQKLNEKGYNSEGATAVVHPVQWKALLADSDVQKTIDYQDEVIRSGVIPELYGFEIRRSTKVPTGTGSGSVTTYHAQIYLPQLTAGLGVSRDLLVETFRDIRKNQTVIKASIDLAAIVIQPASLVQIYTA